jgi:site-specific DNA-methyltransferase (adenine-specific)
MAINRFGQHIPDILDCLAQLSNDEVPTPPKLAQQMLDLLPEDVWHNPDYRWCDPFSKSGVFLREVASRLLDGLADWEPDFKKRRDHIFRNMVFGTSITEMTGIISRRSLYCSHKANGPKSVVRFDAESGNVPFVSAGHTFRNGKCEICGAPETLERGESRENYAYSFIHGAYPTKEMSDMKFDVIVGNPPYQLEDGGYGTSARPIYQLFVEKAIAMNPRHLVMITPSRWFSGGKNLDDFRDRMLKDHHMVSLVDYPKLYDAFPGVKIRGGVSYFLWSREHNGPCKIQTMWDGKLVSQPAERYLDAYDVLIRRNEAVPILDKVSDYRVNGNVELTLDGRVSARKPFAFPTNFHGADSPDGLADPVKLWGSQRVSWVDRSAIPEHPEWIDEWKVLLTAVQGTSAAIETMFSSNPIDAGPAEACTETYLVAGRFKSQVEAERYAGYLRTRFVRFLVSLRKATQHVTRDVYKFVPDLPMDREWTDADLYERYGLTDGEVAFIESQVKEMLPREPVS